MLNEKSLKGLNLTPDQLQNYRELEHKESLFRDALRRCKVHPSAIDKIIAKSDLTRVNPDNIEALEENIKETWSDFIIKKGE